MKWLNKLERKYGKFAIKNLMLYIIAFNAIVFLLTIADASGGLRDRLMLIPSAVLRGEVWRLVTYIFIPPTTDIIWVIFALYFYYMIGMGLEHEWGSFKFNIYYLLGMLGTTLAAFISGAGGTGVYLNLSLFLAFAYIFPDYEILLFFILPVKMKYLGWLDAVMLVYSFFIGGFSAKLAILAAMLNFFVFFGKDIIQYLKHNKSAHSNKKKFEAQHVVKKNYYHKCTICGRTENDDKNLEFRYCSSCEGRYEYCMDHLKEHEHIKKVITVDFTKER